MATYEYKCVSPDCDYTEEFHFPIGKAPDYMGQCPLDEGKMKRVILPAAVSFKGSGFYRTDNPKTKHVKASAKVGGK